MNKDRRKQIDATITDLEKVRGQLEDILAAISDLREEEQEYYDAMPCSFQEGEKGVAAEEAIGNLDNAIEEIENLDVDLVISYLNEAQA